MQISSEQLTLKYIINKQPHTIEWYIKKKCTKWSDSSMAGNMALSCWYAVATIWIDKVSQPNRNASNQKQSQAKPSWQANRHVKLCKFDFYEWMKCRMSDSVMSCTHTHPQVHMRTWLTAWLSKWLSARPREAFKWRTVSTLIVKMRKCSNARS